MSYYMRVFGGLCLLLNADALVALGMVFDGVVTDNMVYIKELGHEMVRY